MASLSTCIKKAGKALDGADATAIREIYNDYVDAGMAGQEAASKAVSDYLDILGQEQAGVLSQIAAQGGQVPDVPGLLRLRYPEAGKDAAIPKELSIIDMLYGDATLPGLSKKPTVRELAKILTARARKLNRGKSFGARTARNKEIISDTLVLETLEAMKQSGHAGHWYSDVLRDALSVAGLIHPEIEERPHSRAAFLFALAITSNGATVKDNTLQAEKVYAEYKRKGKFPLFGVGPEAPHMKKAFKTFNTLKDKWGMDTLVRFLNTEFTVTELELLGLKVNGENKDTLVYGSAIFGPKIGQAFYQNLSGNFEPLTMDRWWMRTWGRIVGNLEPEGISAAQGQADNLLALIDANVQKVTELGYTVEDLQSSDKKLVEFARLVHTQYRRGKYRDRSDLNRAAKLLDEAVHEPIVAPRNGTERNWIREVVAAVQEKLKQRGHDTDTASMQALLWYPEKDFYLKSGVGNERAKPTDYAQEFTNLAVSRGIDKSRISAAIAARRERQSAGDVATATEGAVQEGRGPGIAAKARKQLLQAAAVRTVRETGQPAFTERVPKGAQRELAGAPVSKIHKLAIKAKNRYARSGLATPEFVELSRSPESASLFHKSLKAARAASAAGKSVGLYSVEEYEDMRTFLTNDGLAGFALKGDEIVSVFKHSKAKNQQGMAQASIRLAVEQGARTLTVLDTYAAHLYAQQGFRAISRIPWKAGPGPSITGWSKTHFKPFNNGEPDFVYMVYDQNNFEPYAGDGLMVESAKEAVDLQRAARNALEPRNYPDKPLRYRLDDDMVEETDRDPTSPLSQMHRIAATMEDQIENGPADASALRSAVGDIALGKNARNLEHVLGAIPRRNLKDFVPEAAMPAASDYIRTANRMDGRRNELLADNEVIGKRWTKYISKNKQQGRILGELMHAATLAAVDPAKAYTPLMARANMTEQDRAIDARRRADWTLLNDWWGRLDASGQEIYLEVQEAYSRQRRQVEAALEGRINASNADGRSKAALIADLRAKFEAGRVAGPYFPLSRFGDLWAVAKNAAGDVIAFSKFEQVSEQKQWVKGFRDEGFTVDSGKKMEDMELLNRIDPSFVAQVTALAQELDIGLADEIWQLYLRAMPEMSMRKAFIHRKGRLGFSADAIRSFGHNMFHGAHQLSKLEYMHIMENQLDQMKDQARALEESEDPEALWGNAVYKEMVKRHDWARNPKASILATKLTSLGFAWYLGITPAAALVNLSQTAIVAFPVLAAKYNWLGAGKELLKGATLYAGSRGFIGNRLSGDELAAVNEARRIGLFDKTQAHDLAGVSEEGMDYTSTGRRSMEVISWLFHKAEEANRQITFLAAYRLGRTAALSHEDSILQAEDLVWDSHFDYNNVNRPRYLQNDAAKIILLFRQYSLNMTYRLTRDFNDSLRGASPAQKSEARQRLAGILMMTGIFGGLTAMPLSWLVEGVVDAMMGDDDEPYDSRVALRAYLAELYGPKAAEAIMKGPWDAMTGVTMSSRVSLANLWLREAPANLEGDDLWLHYLGEMAGPIPSIPKDYFQAYSLAREGHIDRAIEKTMPKVAKDTLKAYRFLSEGVQNMRGDVIIPKEEVTNRDAFYQAIGFTPARLTMQYEQNRAVSKASSKIQKRRSHLMDRLFLSARNGDNVGIRDAMQAINKFNRANPTIAVNASNIIASAKSRQKYSEGALNGLNITPKLRYLHEKLRFTPREGETE